MRIKFLFSIVYILLVAYAADAQLCQGSLGDPIVNITFGSGANPGPSLSAATTAYQYVAGDCPSDGFYTVRNNTTACFGNTWHNLTADHSGDPSGYFMLVNASIQPSAFYVDTVKGLCSSSTYEFAAWIMNVILPSACGGNTIQPNLTFSIEKTDGTVLQTYSTGFIAPTNTPTWSQYGNFFTTPAGVTDVVLRIFNNSQGGCGNDLALDDITFRPCGPLITNFINGQPADTVNLCEKGAMYQATLSCTVSGGFSNPVYIWQTWTPSSTGWGDMPIATTTTLGFGIANPLLAGTYRARLAVAESGNLSTTKCRVYSKPFVFIVNPLPVTAVSNNGPVCENAILSLTATGGVNYVWSGPGGFSASGAQVNSSPVQLSHAGKYYVSVTNAAGCTKLDSTLVAVLPTPDATTGFTAASFCEKDSVQLSAFGGGSYEWQPATGLSDAAIANPKASPAVSTDYIVIVSNAQGCRDTAQTSLTLIKRPVVNAGPDKAIMLGQSVQLQGSINENNSVLAWLPPQYIDDAAVLQPIVNPPTDTRYILTATSAAGCGTAYDTVMVKVFKAVYIPSAFSPNGDGLNDTWNIPALAAFQSFELSVYNRFGQQVFHSKNNLKGWDGTFKGQPQPVGAYSYFINLGSSEYILKGSVMIVR
ncbi:MAG: gliding motility-associated C-terminal domain-containing protein [Ferruginibacter sp.]